MKIQKKSKFFLTSSLTLILATNAQASGFRIPEVTVTGSATSNALVANTTEVGAIAYNPASMSFHEKGAFQYGVSSLSYETEVEPTGGTKTKGTGEDSFLIPTITLVVPGGNDISFGLLFNVPFGLETEWAAGTFPSFGGPLAPLEPALSRIEMFNINPNLSFKLDESSSFAFGLNFYDVQDLRFNTQAIEIKGDGTGIGFNLAYMKKIGNINIGISYRSSVKTDLTGTADTSAVGGGYTAATAELEFPDLFQIGVQYQVADNLSIELDLDRTGWSSFDKIDIKVGGSTISSSSNNWDDAWAYRLGMIYKLSGTTKLMFGYSMDESGQPDNYFSARIPDADRQLFSAGVSHRFTSDWVLDVAYLYADVDTRNINSSTAYAGGDANGTAAYNGKYESDVSIFAVSLTMPL